MLSRLISGRLSFASRDEFQSITDVNRRLHQLSRNWWNTSQNAVWSQGAIDRQGDEDALLSYLGRLPPATHNEDLSGKGNSTAGRVSTEGFDDLVFQFRDLRRREGGDFCAKLF